MIKPVDIMPYAKKIITSKPVKIGCAGLTMLTLSVGIFEVEKRKNAIGDYFYRQDNIDESLKTVNKFFSKNPSLKAIIPSLIKTEGIRSTIYNDAAPNIDYKIAQKKKYSGDYTVGIGHRITNQSGNLIRNLEYDIELASKLTGLDVSSKIINEKLTPEQIAVLFCADLQIACSNAKSLTENSINGFVESQVKWNELQEAKKGALISLVFNIGKKKVAFQKGKKTNFLTNFRAGDWEAAQFELDFWSAKSKIKENIIGKRFLEMYLINHGDIPEKTKIKLQGALKKVGINFKTPEKAYKHLMKKYSAEIKSFDESNIW